MVMKKIITLFLALSMILTLAACGAEKPAEATPAPAAPAEVAPAEEAPTQEAEKAEAEAIDVNALGIRDIVFLGGSQTGNWCIVQPTIVNFVEQDIPGCTVTATNGSAVSNLRALQHHEADLAFAHGYVVNSALNGTDDYAEDGKLDNVAVIMATSQSYLFGVTKASSDVYSVDDIVNCNWCAGPAGGGMEVASRNILEAYGITYDAIKANGKKVEFQSMSDAGELMKDGHVDAVFVSGMLTDNIITQQMQSSFDIRIFGFDGEGAQKFLATNPAFGPAVLPANSYKNQTEDVNVFSFNSLLCCRADMDEEAVYLLTKSLYENRAAMAEVVSEMDFIEGENVLNGFDVANLHPGAARYYREIGILK